jgi:hypothetical protein
MQVLGKMVLVLKETPEYSGLIQNVRSDENVTAKVMNIGSGVTMVGLGDKVIINWKLAKPTLGDLWIVSEDDIAAVLED